VIWITRVTYFACTTVDLEKFSHGTPLIDINNAVDDGLVFPYRYLWLWTPMMPGL